MTTAARKSYRIRESASPWDGAPRIDTDRGVVFDVKVLGRVSKNGGRRYLREAVQRAVPLYEGSRVYLNHPQGESNARRFEEHFGSLRGVYERDGELWAKELHYKTAHPLTEAFVWDVKNDPTRIGLSHNADGEGYRDRDGAHVIDTIKKVYSVDLVDGPATTGGLFEQEGAMGDTTPLTDPAATTDATAGTDPGAGGDHKTHLVNAITAIADELRSGSITEDEAKAKIKDLLGMVGGGSTGGDTTPAPAEGESKADETGGDSAGGDLPDELPADEEKKVMEQARKTRVGRYLVRKLDRINVREQAQKRVNKVYLRLPTHAITEQFLDDVRNARDDAHVDRLIEDRKKVATAGRPKSADVAVREQVKLDDLDKQARGGPKPDDAKIKELAAKLWG